MSRDNFLLDQDLIDMFIWFNGLFGRVDLIGIVDLMDLGEAIDYFQINHSECNDVM